MKTHRIILCLFIVTVMALGYVNQQVLVYQMGLRLKENHALYSKLVDHNRILVYNVLNLKSPLSLEAKLLARRVELAMPHKWQIVKIQSSPEKLFQEKVKVKNLFANLFMKGQVAEASPGRK